MMGATKKLKMIMIDKDISGVKMAALVGCPVQTLYNKFGRDTMKYREVERYADLLDCDIVFKDRKTGKMY